jgi:hypothetical protein
MPPKSRRNRRPQTRREISGSISNNITSQNNAIISQAAGQISQPTVSSSKVSKTAGTEAPVGTYFATEVKWIAIVTAIITILLIASYYLFR